MSGSGDEDHQEVWRALTLPAGAASQPPLDATMVAVAAGDRPRPVPRIPVGDAPGVPAQEVTADLVGRLLGEGGMGRVQLAYQRSLDREVALKRPRAGAIFLFRWMWLSGAVIAIGVAVATAYPRVSLAAFATSSMNALVMAALFVRRPDA